MPHSKHARRDACLTDACDQEEGLPKLSLTSTPSLDLTATPTPRQSSALWQPPQARHWPANTPNASNPWPNVQPQPPVQLPRSTQMHAELDTNNMRIDHELSQAAQRTHAAHAQLPEATFIANLQTEQQHPRSCVPASQQPVQVHHHHLSRDAALLKTQSYPHQQPQLAPDTAQQVDSPQALQNAQQPLSWCDSHHQHHLATHQPHPAMAWPYQRQHQQLMQIPQLDVQPGPLSQHMPAGAPAHQLAAEPTEQQILQALHAGSGRVFQPQIQASIEHMQGVPLLRNTEPALFKPCSSHQQQQFPSTLHGNVPDSYRSQPLVALHPNPQRPLPSQQGMDGSDARDWERSERQEHRTTQRVMPAQHQITDAEGQESDWTQNPAVAGHRGGMHVLRQPLPYPGLQQQGTQGDHGYLQHMPPAEPGSHPGGHVRRPDTQHAAAAGSQTVSRQQEGSEARTFCAESMQSMDANATQAAPLQGVQEGPVGPALMQNTRMPEANMSESDAWVAANQAKADSASDMRFQAGQQQQQLQQLQQKSPGTHAVRHNGPGQHPADVTIDHEAAPSVHAECISAPGRSHQAGSVLQDQGMRASQLPLLPGVQSQHPQDASWRIPHDVSSFAPARSKSKHSGGEMARQGRRQQSRHQQVSTEAAAPQLGPMMYWNATPHVAATSPSSHPVTPLQTVAWQPEAMVWNPQPLHTSHPAAAAAGSPQLPHNWPSQVLMWQQEMLRGQPHHSQSAASASQKDTSASPSSPQKAAMWPAQATMWQPHPQPPPKPSRNSSQQVSELIPQIKTWQQP